MIPRQIVAHFLVVSASAFLFGAEIPLSNWTVPPFRAASASGHGITTMTDISPGVGFTATQPCRVVDTRGGGAFTGPYGPPILAAGAIRTFDINSVPHCGGIPAGAEAYSLNFTVTQTGGSPGDIRVWPTGNPPLPGLDTSVLNWTVTNATVANATIVPAGTGGSIDVQVAGSNTHLLIDINGYFTAEQNPGQSFRATSTTEAPAIIGENTSTSSAATAILGILTSTNPGGGGAAIRGISNATSNLAYAGHFSSTGTGIALNVEGLSGTGLAAQGVVGVIGQGSFAGISGTAIANAGLTYGVKGHSASASDNSAGVYGNTFQIPNSSGTNVPRAGVRGESQDGIGAVGLSEFTGVGGFLMNPSDGTPLAQGRLGTAFGTDPDGGGPPWGVHAVGAIGATGFKAFLEPHPTDPTKVIQYVALEGPEAGTYFRGKAKFERGLATIPVPEDFRMVTDPEGLTVQITPIGEMASFAVARMGLQEIVVKGSRDVEFSYLVQGVRASFKDVRPVIRDGTFVPQSAEERLPEALAARQKRLLISNGTYNPDGTINMATARRLGWDQMWARRSAARPSPQPEGVK
jgi:hypothetical protein